MAGKLYELEFKLSDGTSKKVQFEAPAGPQGPAYTLTEADKAEIVQRVHESIGTPVFGMIEGNNDILLSGDLADESYSVKYKMKDGSKVNIGNLVIDTRASYSVTKNLTNCAISNSATEIREGESYSATVTADSGYELKNVSVTMGGDTVSVSGGVINIAIVTGNIVITAVAEVPKPAYNNLLPLSVNADGSDYRGTNGEDGYKSGYKMSTSTGNESSTSGAWCSGFMEIEGNESTISIANITLSSAGSVNNLVFYDESKTRINGAQGVAGAFNSGVRVANGIYSFEPKYWVGSTGKTAKFFRFSCGGISDATIVVENEEIA